MPMAYIHDVDDVRGPLSNQSDFDSDSEERKATLVSGSTELVDFGTPDQPKELRIRTFLSHYERSRLIDLLRSYLDVFAWSYKDMLGLHPSIVQHRRDSETTIFHDMMHRDVETVQVKIESREVHLWVTSGTLLRHIVSEHGIEVDPKKIRAILDMPAPRTERKIRGFLGRLQYISCFIARLIDICEPIFRLLRKSQPTVWDDDYQHAFEKIKECLLSSPVLVPPTPRCPLLLYLSISDTAMGCMLAQLDDLGKERAIYYLSKRMLKYECRYIMIERLCLALVWASRRLRHNVTKYSVLLISRLDPLRYLFDRPILTSRLTRWLVLLIEFDIQYVTQKLVKGSIVANHLVSLPISDDRPVDDDFPYEQVVSMTSLETVLDLGVGQLEIHGDSNLVIQQTQGIWRTRDEKLKPYHAYLDLLVDRIGSSRWGCNYGDACFPNRYGFSKSSFNPLNGKTDATLASVIKIPAGMTVRPLLIEIMMDYHVVVISFRGAYSARCTILLKSSSGHEYILVAIDYFTKWVETASYARLTVAKVAKFIRSHIICRYGVPHELISNRGVNFREKLLFALWAYLTSFRSSTGATPYSLVYGMEVVLLIEIEMRYLRVALE
ncbi:Retrovirus-related Pol polyprotein from transposon 17.6 [Vitis vinifera]|uniref:Retrovirus-related Pol polyprotein from transposon 17.6 n=1 Tax=Vitis vinifera TaxID=29760 RepID=A0A438FGI1_VITVI|nr:Retrovirus-related Pol polyprotein from transposon 17.6 [Vitis vinifera]